jgi:UDP-N-acetylglucosamine 1-carboxyvinyltransferase
MRYYEIEGGKPLQGHIKIEGAKNAASKQIVASLLTSEECVLDNVPPNGETDLTLRICKSIGLQAEWDTANSLALYTPAIRTSEIPQAFAGLNRIPILMFGPLLHRTGRAIVPILGGDAIGPRPVDFHIQALERLGAKINFVNGRYEATASQLRGAVIDLPYPSVGATENILLTSVLAKGTTLIKNAAMEPEVLDTIMMLQNMGAIIFVDVDRTIVIEGVESLHGVHHYIIPDRIEAASWAIAGIVTGGNVFVEGARQSDMLSFLNTLQQVGAGFEVRNNGIRFFHRGQPLKSLALQTDVHPGFMTDWQQPFVILMTQMTGISVLHETVYEDRFGYTEELKRMGAEIQLYSQCLGSKDCRFKSRDYDHSCIVRGPTQLHAADINIPDLRAGFSYLIAAVLAKGVSKVRGIQYVERGYSNILGKFQALAANITEHEE